MPPKYGFIKYSTVPPFSDPEIPIEYMLNLVYMPLTSIDT